VSISRRARARTEPSSTARVVVSAFALRCASPLRWRVSCATDGSRSLLVFAIFRIPPPPDVTRSEGSGELGRLPLSGRPAFRAGPRGSAWGAARWRPRSTRPMSAAHGFSFQNDRPLVSAHSASYFPTRYGSHRFTRWSRFGEPTCDLRGVLFLAAACRRTSDTSSLRGLPRRNASVHRRWPAERTWRPSGRTREPRPPFAVARERSRQRVGPEASSTPPRLRSDRRPGSARFLASRCVHGQSPHPQRREEDAMRGSAVSPTLRAHPCLRSSSLRWTSSSHRPETMHP
jgi:hypothetical protein